MADFEEGEVVSFARKPKENKLNEFESEETIDTEPVLPPQKTIKAYKLFRIKGGDTSKLYPLFVNANTPVETGRWIAAEVGPLTDKGKVKSKIGQLAFRPGWHAGDLPQATHIGEGGTPGKPEFRPKDQVWAEVEFPADINWQEEANKRAKRNKQGEIIARTAQITDTIPEGFLETQRSRQ